MNEAPILVGCDFSSSPARRKPIVMAGGRLADAGAVVLEGLEYLPTLEAFAAWLAQPRSWICAFDFPFGLPRELVEQLGWPTDWEACIRHYASLPRAEIRARFAAFCDARPVGGKYAHRAFDRLSGASSSMKWVNPPVAFMLHAGVPPLIASGAKVPGLKEGDPARVALEAYPGLLSRELIGRRSYKNDTKAKQTPALAAARQDLIAALEAGRTRLGLRLVLNAEQREALAEDASGDSVDAVLCLLQAAWAAGRGAPRYGLPEHFDPLEGWIVSA